jgi:hypothetical protein
MRLLTRGRAALAEAADGAKLSIEGLFYSLQDEILEFIIHGVLLQTSADARMTYSRRSVKINTN